MSELVPAYLCLVNSKEKVFSFNCHILPDMVDELNEFLSLFPLSMVVSGA